MHRPRRQRRYTLLALMALLGPGIISALAGDAEGRADLLEGARRGAVGVAVSEADPTRRHFLSDRVVRGADYDRVQLDSHARD